MSIMWTLVWKKIEMNAYKYAYNGKYELCYTYNTV